MACLYERAKLQELMQTTRLGRASRYALEFRDYVVEVP